MKVQTNAETVEAIKKVIEQQTDRPGTVRIFLAGFGCGGPSFGLALDDQKEDDIVDESAGIKFIMAKDVFENHGDFKVEFLETGYLVAPVNQAPSSCSSCSSCGGH